MARQPQNRSTSERFSDTVKRLPRPIELIAIRRLGSRPSATYRLAPTVTATLPRRRL